MAARLYTPTRARIRGCSDDLDFGGFGSWWLVLYAGIALTAVVIFVKGYEEPTLTSTYGEQYLEYRRNVPGWWPRITPWRA